MTTCCSFTPVVRVCAALLGPLRGRNSTRCCRSAKLLVFTIMHSNTRQAVRVDAFGVREMVLGKSRQAHQRTIMHSNTRQAANNHALEHSTGSERVDAFGLRELEWYWVNHGRLTSERQAHQRTQSLPSATHRHSSITRPCCSSAQVNHSTLLLERSSAKLLVFYAGSPANNHALEHSTGSCLLRVDAFATRRRGNHMHDHSRFQRDID